MEKSNARVSSLSEQLAAVKAEAVAILKEKQGRPSLSTDERNTVYNLMLRYFKQRICQRSKRISSYSTR